MVIRSGLRDLGHILECAMRKTLTYTDDIIVVVKYAVYAIPGWLGVVVFGGHAGTVMRTMKEKKG